MNIRHLKRSFTVLGLCLGLNFGLTGTAMAQRVIKLVVPFGPGAVQDTVARAFSNELGQALGATVVVENKAGAGGTIGTAQVAKSAPDGNTLVVAAASHTLAGHLYAKLPYDPIKDFTGVALLGNTGYAIGVPAKLGVSTLADFIKLVKSKPGEFNYATAGNGSATHLGMASFLAKAGLKMEHIPLKSTGDAVNEVLAGRAEGVMAASIALVAFRQDARVKLLAYTGAQRTKVLPDLPTVAEAGLPGYRFDSWVGVLAPAGTPKAEVDRINSAMNKVMADPVVAERFARLGIDTLSTSADEFNKVLRADWEVAGQIVKAAGAKVE